MKFGGTSVANLNRIKKVAQIVKKNRKKKSKGSGCSISYEWCNK